MSPQRKAAQDFVIKWITEISPKGTSGKMYADLFASMDDGAFESFMSDIEAGKTSLAIISPNFSDTGISTERNLKIAKEPAINHNFFQRIYIGKEGNRSAYLTPIPYLVVKLPLRRQAQLLTKKIAIPEDNKVVDDFTGQPTGRSKGSKISYPETQVMAALDLTNCLTELLKYRGGDTKGFDAMNDSISKTGGASEKVIRRYAGGVDSTRTLKNTLISMMLSTTL